MTFIAALPAQAEKAPNFILDRVEGGRMKLAEVLGEGPVLLNFWATWCKPCKKEIPHLVALQKEFGDRGFTVVGISLDDKNSMSRVKPTVKKLKINYPVVLDPTKSYAKRVGASTLPTNVILNKEGEVVERVIGFRPGMEKELRAQVLKLIGEPASEGEAAAH